MVQDFDPVTEALHITQWVGTNASNVGDAVAYILTGNGADTEVRLDGDRAALVKGVGPGGLIVDNNEIGDSIGANLTFDTQCA